MRGALETVVTKSCAEGTAPTPQGRGPLSEGSPFATRADSVDSTRPLASTAATAADSHEGPCCSPLIRSTGWARAPEAIVLALLRYGNPGPFLRSRASPCDGQSALVLGRARHGPRLALVETPRRRGPAMKLDSFASYQYRLTSVLCATLLLRSYGKESLTTLERPLLRGLAGNSFLFFVDLVPTEIDLCRTAAWAVFRLHRPCATRSPMSLTWRPNRCRQTSRPTTAERCIRRADGVARRGGAQHAANEPR